MRMPKYYFGIHFLYSTEVNISKFFLLRIKMYILLKILIVRFKYFLVQNIIV